jgi:hypothetical protein
LREERKERREGRREKGEEKKDGLVVFFSNNCSTFSEIFAQKQHFKNFYPKYRDRKSVV